MGFSRKVRMLLFLVLSLGLVLVGCKKETGEESFKVNKVTSLEQLVEGTSVQDQAQKVDINTSIQIKFKVPMDTEATSKAVYMEDQDGNPVFGTISWSDDKKVMTFKPNKPLKESTLYGFYVTSAAKPAQSSENENIKLSPIVINFTTQETKSDNFQNVNFRLSSTNIVDGATDVSTSPIITLNFKNPVNEATVKNNIKLEDADGNEVEIWTTISSDFRTIEIRPTTHLKYSTDYILTVKRDLKDIFGQSLCNPQCSEDEDCLSEYTCTDYTISFKTKAAPPPPDLPPSEDQFDPDSGIYVYPDDTRAISKYPSIDDLMSKYRFKSYTDFAFSGIYDYSSCPRDSYGDYIVSDPRCRYYEHAMNVAKKIAPDLIVESNDSFPLSIKDLVANSELRCYKKEYKKLFGFIKIKLKWFREWKQKLLVDMKPFVNFSQRKNYIWNLYNQEYHYPDKRCTIDIYDSLSQNRVASHNYPATVYVKVRVRPTAPEFYIITYMFSQPQSYAPIYNGKWDGLIPPKFMHEGEGEGVVFIYHRPTGSIAGIVTLQHYTGDYYTPRDIATLFGEDVLYGDARISIYSAMGSHASSLEWGKQGTFFGINGSRWKKKWDWIPFATDTYPSSHTGHTTITLSYNGEGGYTPYKLVTEDTEEGQFFVNLPVQLGGRLISRNEEIRKKTWWIKQILGKLVDVVTGGLSWWMKFIVNKVIGFTVDIITIGPSNLYNNWDGGVYPGGFNLRYHSSAHIGPGGSSSLTWYFVRFDPAGSIFDPPRTTP